MMLGMSVWALVSAGVVLFVLGFTAGLLAGHWVVVLASHAVVASRTIVQKGVEVRNPAYNSDAKAADWEEQIEPRRAREFQIPRR